MAWLVVRVRGTLHARRDIAETLRCLHLTRANHATIVPETPAFRGMLAKVQGYVTWGEAEASAVELLLRERGVAEDGRWLREPAPDGSAGADLSRLAAEAAAGGMGPLAGVRPLFRLKAPAGGWRSTKKPYRLGGALGYRGPAINDLARRMV
ncbi:MAG: 50S ribosomal protein L30 [Thermoplasmata archaeon]